MMNGNIKTFLAVGMILLLFIFSTPIYGQEKGGAGYFITGAGWVLESGDSSIVYSVGGGGHITKADTTRRRTCRKGEH